MVSYNTGRFIFMFDPINEELIGVYDTNYASTYTKDHPAFNQAYECALEQLSTEALNQLIKKMGDDDKYGKVVKETLFKRENLKESK